MKTLTLNLKCVYFDQILAGKKTHVQCNFGLSDTAGARSSSLARSGSPAQREVAAC